MISTNEPRTPLCSGFPAGGLLSLKAPKSGFDPRTFKPVLKVKIAGGVVRLSFTKEECTAVAIYSRLRGTSEWTSQAVRLNSPFLDLTPLAVPHSPEVREYAARGILRDKEVGFLSDIVTITLS